MRGMRRAVLAIALAALRGASFSSAQDPAASGEREPFASPLTPDEARWLLDAEDAQRFRRLPADRLPDAAPRELPPQIRAIQESLGGSMLEQFDSLQGEGRVATPWWKRFDAPPAPAADPSPIWPDPAAENERAGAWPRGASSGAPRIVVPTTAEMPLSDPTAPVVALRHTAAELDDAANRLEELELYRQSDALRELAQGLRIDARRMTAGHAEAGPQRRSSVGPIPDLAPPADPAVPNDSDAWNDPSPQRAAPNAEN